MNILALVSAGFTIATLIHVGIALLILVLIGWIILWILEQIAAPVIARKIIIVIGGLIAILILLNLLFPFA